MKKPSASSTRRLIGSSTGSMRCSVARPLIPTASPIPNPEGTLVTHDYQTLLTCPVGTPVVLIRVTDQDAAFLRFLENSDLKPGQALRVEARDGAADQVVVRGKNDRQIMIGMRAAAKLQVAPDSGQS